jgi:hypothetical protein
MIVSKELFNLGLERCHQVNQRQPSKLQFDQRQADYRLASVNDQFSIDCYEVIHLHFSFEDCSRMKWPKIVRTVALRLAMNAKTG